MDRKGEGEKGKKERRVRDKVKEGKKGNALEQ